MKKLLTLLLISTLLTSCSNDDDNGIDCLLFDPLFPELYIRLVDETGANLIENGTIDPENITVEGDFPNPNFIYIPPNEFGETDADVTKYDNTLSLFIPRESKFEYSITLNGSTSILLEFDARLEELPCGISYFVPVELTYDTQNVESENAETNELIFLAEIEI